MAMADGTRRPPRHGVGGAGSLGPPRAPDAHRRPHCTRRPPPPPSVRRRCRGASRPRPTRIARRVRPAGIAWAPLLLLAGGGDRAGIAVAYYSFVASSPPMPMPRPPALALALPPSSRLRRPGPLPPPCRLSAASYGRGAEIWPPGSEVRVRLEDSFPKGVVPPEAAIWTLSLPPVFPDEDGDGDVVEGDGATQLTAGVDDDGASVTGGGRRRGRGRIWRIILRRAARFERAKSADPPAPRTAEEIALDASRPSPIPAALAIALVSLGLVRSTEILFVLAFSGYLVLLTRLGRTEMGSGDGDGDGGGGVAYRRVPTLPPQGHVPSLVSNPLGHRWTSSGGYRAWLRTGAVLGLLAPVGAAGYYYAVGRTAAAGSCAGPVFLICCQALTEAVSRRAMAPLPVRILIPVAYNARRLGLVWDWALSSSSSASSPLGRPGRVLAIANLIYWAANLFGFLLPVACPRYMRAHFFCVEASEVSVREGHEDAVGLLPRS